MMQISLPLAIHWCSDADNPFDGGEGGDGPFAPHPVTGSCAMKGGRDFWWKDVPLVGVECCETIHHGVSGQ